MNVIYNTTLLLFVISTVMIFYAMVGYPLLLMAIEKIIKPEKLKKNSSYEPTVTLMIVAHNEEKVINDKLKNSIELDYPSEKLEILVASDNSTDMTNEIVEMFIVANKTHNIRLYCSQEHEGKTNAQNEAQKTISSEIIVMTDANPMLDKNAIRELVASFAADDVAYVCGKLVYSNSKEFNTSETEAAYWNYDLRMRDIESRLYTITAGNGALYACRNKDYVDFLPIECHDSAMPRYYSMVKKKALFNPDALAYEKAGENNGDEFKRKVRMNRTILSAMLSGLKFMNVFKYKWFSFFYFGHRTCRYSLWLYHLIAILCSIILAIQRSALGIVALAVQVVYIILTCVVLKFGIKFKPLRLIAFYGMTIAAQIVAVYKNIKGDSKAIWEKAESTR